MTPVRRLTLVFAAARGGFGLGLIAAPGKVASGWIGDDAQRPAAQVAVRGLGVRDLALAGGAAAAVLDGSDMRPWLVASVACDLADIGTTMAAGAGALPDRSRPGTLALAGFSALAGAALALAAR
jgi:hypothetical protein